MELEITWGRAVRVWWSYLWRNLVAILITFTLSMVLGFIIGFAMATMGASTAAIYAVTAPLAFVISLAASVVPLKMILGKDFGEFRLVLLAKQPLAGTAAAHPKRSRRNRRYRGHDKGDAGSDLRISQT